MTAKTLSRTILLVAVVLTLASCAQGYSPSSLFGGGRQYQFYDGGTTMQATMPDERVGGSQ